MIEVYPSPSQVARGRAVTGCRSPFAVLIEAAENSWSESVDPALDSSGAVPQTSLVPESHWPERHQDTCGIRAGNRLL